MAAYASTIPLDSVDQIEEVSANIAPETLEAKWQMKCSTSIVPNGWTDRCKGEGAYCEFNGRYYEVKNAKGDCKKSCFCKFF